MSAKVKVYVRAEVMTYQWYSVSAVTCDEAKEIVQDKIDPISAIATYSHPGHLERVIDLDEQP